MQIFNLFTSFLLIFVFSFFHGAYFFLSMSYDGKAHIHSVISAEVFYSQQSAITEVDKNLQQEPFHQSSESELSDTQVDDEIFSNFSQYIVFYVSLRGRSVDEDFCKNIYLELKPFPPKNNFKTYQV